MRSMHADLLVRQDVEGHGIINAQNIDEYITNSLEIYARASQLFDFARRKTDNAPDDLKFEDMRTAARICEIWEYEFPDLYALLGRRFEPTQN